MPARLLKASIIFAWTFCCAQYMQPQSSASESPTVNEFDRLRNAAADIERAMDSANKSGKRILLDVGGDWCQWCRAFGQLFQEQTGLAKLRDAHFILVKVYYGPDNTNNEILSRYPKLQGIPHMFVLDANGSVLRSQHMVELQTRGSYDAQKVRQFLLKWSAKE